LVACFLGCGESPVVGITSQPCSEQETCGAVPPGPAPARAPAMSPGGMGAVAVVLATIGGWPHSAAARGAS